MNISIHGNTLIANTFIKVLRNIDREVSIGLHDSDVHIIAYDYDEKHEMIDTLLKIESISKTPIIINTSMYGLHTTYNMSQYVPDATWFFISDCTRHGNTIKSFYGVDLLTIGYDGKESSKDFIYGLFDGIFEKDNYLFMPYLDAELSKIALSGILATKISYINDIAMLSEEIGCDIENIRKSITSDSRVGPEYMYPGVGFGGSGFISDINTLSYSLNEFGIKSTLIDQVKYINERQHDLMFRRLWKYFDGDLSGKNISILGTSFKPGTSRINNSPSIPLIKSLLFHGAIVKTNDPMANEEIKKMFKDIQIHECVYSCITRSDACVIITDWENYVNLDFDIIKRLMKTPLVLDGRNMYNPKYIKQFGIEYYGVGR